MKKQLGPKPIIFPTPILVVGTYDENEKPNGMAVAWGGVCSSEPPAVTIAVRKQRKTYDNLCKNMAFTVNIPNEGLMEEADFFGVVSGKKLDKFEHSGLTPVKGQHVNAPYIEEFPLSLECKVISSTEIGQHVVFIGEIINMIADESVVDEKGNLDAAKVGAIGYDPAGSNYTSPGKIIGKAFKVGLAILKKNE
jgi:flavin reductase (DIM6/NTAB) family NADH-FMN oxidoreductase RutF